MDEKEQELIEARDEAYRKCVEAVRKLREYWESKAQTGGEYIVTNGLIRAIKEQHAQ